MNQKPTILGLLLMNIPTILFLVGIVFINVSVYLIFNTNIGILTSGITLVVIALIINYEQSRLPKQTGG